MKKSTLPQIVPTVLATTPQEFGAIIERLKPFAKRLHIDIADGEFAPNTTINLPQAYWPEEIRADLHLMINKPGMRTEICISLKPHLVIVHAEASDHGYASKLEMIQQLKAVGIKTGLALLPHTAVRTVVDLLRQIDHVLVFSGRLGFYGGRMQKDVLAKIAQIRSANRGVEIAVDGGINADNIAEVVEAGADVLNVGGYIQKAEDPAKAYTKLLRLVEKAS